MKKLSLFPPASQDSQKPPSPSTTSPPSSSNSNIPESVTQAGSSPKLLPGMLSPKSRDSKLIRNLSAGHAMRKKNTSEESTIAQSEDMTAEDELAGARQKLKPVRRNSISSIVNVQAEVIKRPAKENYISAALRKSSLTNSLVGPGDDWIVERKGFLTKKAFTV